MSSAQRLKQTIQWITEEQNERLKDNNVHSVTSATAYDRITENDGTESDCCSAISPSPACSEKEKSSECKAVEIVNVEDRRDDKYSTIKVVHDITRS